MAGSMAVRDAVEKGSPTLKEPIMSVEVIMPEEYLGDVIGDLNGRRGSIDAYGSWPGGTQVITAKVPLAEMFGYATALRSMTPGQGIVYDGAFALRGGARRSLPRNWLLKMTGRPLVRR